MKTANQNPKTDTIWSQPARFVVTGLCNTFLGLTIIFVAKWLGELNDFAANVLGYTVGLLVSFYLNKKWTFRHNGRVLPTAKRFVMAFLLSYVANLVVVYWLRDGAGMNSYLAQAMGIIPYTVIFYLSSRYYVFRKDHGAGFAKPMG